MRSYGTLLPFLDFYFTHEVFRWNTICPFCHEILRIYFFEPLAICLQIVCYVNQSNGYFQLSPEATKLK
jgi:hypothetical protein